jgi:hypothetical protein
MNQLLSKICLCMPLVFLAGCGTSSYGDAVKKSQPELERRGKFAVLGPGYKRFPTFPIAFRIPKMFLEDDMKAQRWISSRGEAMKLNSRDPIELINNPDARGTRPDLAIPAELRDAVMDQAHQGTYLCEFKVETGDPANPDNKEITGQSLTLMIWIFDSSPQSKIKPPNDTLMLGRVKALAKAPAKSGGWEDDAIDTIATPENPSPAPISAKLARIPVAGKFMVARDANRVMTEKKGSLRLWSFRLDNKYQVFLAIRASSNLTEGDAAEFPQDPENPSSDKLLEIGRAIIGSMAVVPDTAPEGEAKK